MLEERDHEKRRAEQQRQRVEELHIENLRLQLELERLKKWYYGPCADRLQSSDDLAQLLLHFAEELDRKPINADDLPRQAEPQEELRRVKRRDLAKFDNLPVSTRVYELSAQERACPCCGETAQGDWRGRELAD
jgi:hypothetical protein